MQLDFNAVGKVLAESVVKHMPASHQIQSLVTLEKKATGVGQTQLLPEGEDARTAEQDGFDHEVQISTTALLRWCASAQSLDEIFQAKIAVDRNKCNFVKNSVKTTENTLGNP